MIASGLPIVIQNQKAYCSELVLQKAKNLKDAPLVWRLS